MDGTLRMARRVALALVLALGAAIATTGLSPISHASPLPPSISARYDGTYVYVTGSGFTPGSTVYVAAIDQPSGYVVSTFTTATPSGGCTRSVCFVGGTINVTIPVAQPSSFTVQVIAHDDASDTFSNWVTAQIPFVL